ncbi:MAG: geranylgeranylglycerol-phosphate geranylgeranyltransferase [Gemmatimonadaceae bacterium]|nr:geranylgeranylglycerol-phosphate geranylgeranyltransferase [Gemmatimonadaceae bacterium]
MKGLSRLRLRTAAAAALARPPNCALTAVSVWVGALASGHPHATAGVAAAAAAAAAVAAAGNGLNDVLDLPADRVNRPDRPLPSGRLSPAAALVLSTGLGAAGLGTAFVVGLAPGAIAFAVAAGLALYNWWWKRLGLAGNLLVSLLAAATFPYGAVAAGGGGRWWVPAAFALVYHLGREILKGAEDVEGDRVHGARTLASLRGERAAERAAAALLAVTALAAPLPALLGIYGWGYLAPVVLLDVLLARTCRDLWRGSPSAGRQSRRLLPGMVLGLAAVVLGELVDRGG